MLPGLTRDEILRYSRHLLIPEVGLEGQRKLKGSSALIIGTGGLGAPVALKMAAAGIGRIGLVDYDVVDSSNLQRQVIHGTSTVGKLKVESAKAKLVDLNPDIEVDVYNEPFTSENAMRIARDYDILLDGTDNFPTRYLTNDVAVFLGKPNVYASIYRFDGQVAVFYAKQGPCYRCLYPEPPPPGLVPSCAEGGVLGVLPGAVGTLQAIETIKLILGIGKPLIGRLLLFDALAMEWRSLKLRKDPNCPVCGEKPTVTKLIDYEAFCGLKEPAPALPEISVEELKGKLDRKERFVLLDVREPHEYEIARITGSRLIPLGALPERLGELDKSRPLVVHCKMGGRSAKAVKLLREKGFDAVNVAGGINAWSERVDPSVPTY